MGCPCPIASTPIDRSGLRVIALGTYARQPLRENTMGITTVVEVVSHMFWGTQCSRVPGLPVRLLRRTYFTAVSEESGGGDRTEHVQIRRSAFQRIDHQLGAREENRIPVLRIASADGGRNWATLNVPNRTSCLFARAQTEATGGGWYPSRRAICRARSDG